MCCANTRSRPFRGLCAPGNGSPGGGPRRRKGRRPGSPRSSSARRRSRCLHTGLVLRRPPGAPGAARPSQALRSALWAPARAGTCPGLLLCGECRSLRVAVGGAGRWVTRRGPRGRGEREAPKASRGPRRSARPRIAGSRSAASASAPRCNKLPGAVLLRVPGPPSEQPGPRPPLPPPRARKLGAAEQTHK